MFLTATAMTPLPVPTLAGLAALLLLAAMPAPAAEPDVVAASETTVALAAAPAEIVAERQASEPAPPPLVIEPREYSSPSRPSKPWITRGEVDSGSYRMSLSRGKLDMGLGFEAPVGQAHRIGRSVDPSGPIVATLPSLSVGLRSDSAGPPPSSLIARASGEGAVPASSRRIGLEWKPAQSSLFVRGGVRLVGDDRITMRLKGGRVGVYMKSTF